MFGIDEIREFCQDSGVYDIFFYSYSLQFTILFISSHLCAFWPLFLTERQRKRKRKTGYVVSPRSDLSCFSSVSFIYYFCETSGSFYFLTSVTRHKQENNTTPTTLRETHPKKYIFLNYISFKRKLIRADKKMDLVMFFFFVSHASESFHGLHFW